MNKFIMMVVALVTTFFATGAMAFTPPPPPADGRHIVDQASKLTPEQLSMLEKRIESMNSSTKNEFGVLILSSMDGDNIEDVANATFKSWGVGKRGLDNGVLLVISVAERKSRLETGKGVGGDLPDLRCNQILKSNLAPHLKQGDFYGGIDSTLGAVGSQLESRANQKAEPKSAQPSCQTSAPGFSTGSVLFLLLVGDGLSGILYARARARRKEEEFRQKEIAARRRREEERTRIEREEKAFAERQAQERETRMQRISTPPVPVPEIVRKPTVPRPTVKTTTPTVAKAATVSAAVLAAEAAEAANRARRMREEREAEERRARQRREEEDRQRREREEEDRRSSYSSYSSSSSSSSFDWGGSSGGSDSGSGFGGGDSGGGGSSGDW